MTDHTTQRQREERIAREFRAITRDRTELERTALSIACLEHFYGLNVEVDSAIPAEMRRWARVQAARLELEDDD